MKYLLRVLFILALVCGFSSVARADALDFHAGVADPSCDATLSNCGIGISDVGVPFAVDLTSASCLLSNSPLTGLPTPSGCFFGTNNTGETITSITLDFAAIQGVTGCDTALTGVSNPLIFTNSTCTPLGTNGSGGFALSFSGGPGVGNGDPFFIVEEGVAPGDFAGTAVVASTPEPDSVLLLSTGMMMMGLYMAGRTRLFAFLKK